MIDFDNKKVFKLTKMKEKNIDSLIMPSIGPLLLDDEKIINAYTALRDYMVFTDKRIIAVNVQGLIGSKKDFTSMPYSKIQLFSIETSGTFDMDSELELCFSGVGTVKFEFSRDKEITEIAKTIAKYVL